MSSSQKTRKIKEMAAEHRPSVVEFVYGVFFWYAFITYFIFLLNIKNINNIEIELIWVIFVMGVILLFQMARTYNVLHEIDHHINVKTHYYSILTNNRFDKILRIIIAFLIIYITKNIGIENQSVLKQITFQFTGWLIGGFQALSDFEMFRQIPSVTLIESSVYYDPVILQISMLSVFMVLIYLVFIFWDLNLIMTAETIADGSLTLEKLKSIHLYLNPKKLLISNGESEKQHNNRIKLFIINPKFNYFRSEKFQERVKGSLFFLSIFFFLNTNVTFFAVIIISVMAYIFLSANLSTYKDTVLAPIKLLLSILK